MSTYAEARQQILLLMSQVRDVIDQAPEGRREQLWDVASDDLSDAMTGQWQPSALAEAFRDASRDFWLREQYSVRVAETNREPGRHLRVLKSADFDDLIKEGA